MPEDEDEALALEAGWASVSRLRLSGAGEQRDEDRVAVEAPLELRIGGVPIAVVMRTPGHDLDLAWGFLRSESIVTGREEVQRVQHCDTVDDPRAEDNVVQIRLRPGCEVDLAALRRNLYASSSCGICGKASLERALDCAPPHAAFAPMPDHPALWDLQRRLRAAQANFDLTGGLHAAGIAEGPGALRVVREDVGRHNAVDKAIGALFREGSLPADGSLVVSGRVSFEIVQKALAAGLRRIVAVSAPTSLAIELAREARIGLAAFVREDGASIYAGPR